MYSVFWIELMDNVILQPENAHVAELVDAADSKSAIRKGVKVRFLSWALKRITVKSGPFLFYFFIKA